MKKVSKVRNQSAEYACGRMKLLLTSERMDCSQQMINLLKRDLIHTIRRYLAIDEEQVKIEISQEPLTLHLNVPVKKIRNDDL